jgi:carotenoid cleavage dioxygenase-like enzyme
VNKLCKSKADDNVFKKSMFVGMDVHKNYLQVAVVDERGKILNNSRVDNNLIKVNESFDSLHPSSNTKVVMESSGMWYIWMPGGTKSGITDEYKEIILSALFK